ncbi:MAG: glycosyltransferase [Acidobacteriia bacterium]|nr:glycosyltransferase [Terriglobia bacterium]
MAARQPHYRVTILVLGDLGRSPRMLNQAWALAEDGAAVSLAGYHETPVDRAVAEHPRIRLHRVRSLDRAREGRSRILFLLFSAWRAAFLGLESFWLLLARTPRADVVLVQNPPSFPTLLAGWLAARARRSLFIVDWHNFGYAMLALRLGPAHFMVRLAKACERWLGSQADAHLCVSAAMRDVLTREFGLPAAVVLPDRPRELLPLLPMTARSAAAHRVLSRAGFVLPQDAALAVCPTSWSADEDMDLLLEGLQRWDSQGAPSPLPRLCVVITGRGPLREAFEQRISGLCWRRLTLRTAFLDPADYRELLCAAHFGFCLHRSTSGVDLPMKLMDLFGARTPACVLDYGECLTEQIQPGVTALTFRTSQELACRIDQLLAGFPDDLQLLAQMQCNIQAACTETWQQVWQREAAPVFHRVLRSA